VLAAPILVPELLRVLLASPSVGASEWDKLASRLDRAGELRTLLADLEGHLGAPDLAGAESSCRKALEVMANMNWDYLLGSHAAGNSVRARASEYRSMKEMRAKDCAALAAYLGESLCLLEGRKEYE